MDEEKQLVLGSLIFLGVGVESWFVGLDFILHLRYRIKINCEHYSHNKSNFEGYFKIDNL